MKKHRSIPLVWEGRRTYISGSPTRPVVSIHYETRAARHHGEAARRLIDAICECRPDLRRALTYRWGQ